MYKMSVPLVAQAKDSTCWHASSMMIWQYWQQQTGRQGPMNTISPKWEGNETISPPEFITLASQVGLKSLPSVANNTNESLETMLKANGPIWCAGYWYGPGHIVVLTGVDSGIVHINDPDGGKPKLETVAWFNSKLASQFPGSFMAKDAARY